MTTRASARATEHPDGTDPARATPPNADAPAPAAAPATATTPGGPLTAKPEANAASDAATPNGAATATPNGAATATPNGAATATPNGAATATPNGAGTAAPGAASARTGSGSLTRDGLPIWREVRGEHVLSSDPEIIDIDSVYRWLATDSYWAANRPRDIVERSIQHSVVLGVYRADDHTQVAFARVVTDRATFGWLCDVYVDPAARGYGLGTWLAETARDLLAEIGVLRIILATMDAHGVYAKAGFEPFARPDRWMEIDRRNTP